MKNKQNPINDSSFDLRQYLKVEERRKLKNKYGLKMTLSLIASFIVGLFSQIGTYAYIHILGLQNLSISKILFIILSFQCFVVYYVVFSLLYDNYTRIFKQKGLEVEE